MFGTAGTGGFSFGSTTTTPQTTASTQPSSGFSFGGNTGFSFGGQTKTATTTAPGASLFSTPTATATGGFAFAGAGAPKPAATTAAAAPSTAGFSFGSTPTQATQVTQPTSQPGGLAGFSFANTGQTLGSTAQTKPGGFAFPTSTPQATSAGTGLKLGAPTATTGIRPTTTPTVTPGGSFTFGAAAPTAAAQKPTLAVPATAATAATSAPPLGFGFGTQQSTSTTSAPTAVKHTLGGQPAQTAFGSIKLGTTATSSASSSTPTTGFTLGSAPTASTTAPATLKLGGTASSTTGGLGLTFGSSTTTPAATVASTTSKTLPQMNYRQLEDSINKWTVELQEQEKIFLQQATQVNAWDRLLIENGEKITHLNSDVERVKLDQQRLDNELDFIRAQQRELEELLAPLETSVQQLPSISYQQHADLEREHTYQLAENIDAQLKRMVQDLKEIIDHVNSTNSNQDNNDPINQITKILNAHMDSLQWIDQNSNLLNRRVEDITKQMDLQRKEQERNFRLAYD